MSDSMDSKSGGLEGMFADTGELERSEMSIFGTEE